MQKRDDDAPTQKVPPRMVSVMEEKSDSLKRSHSEDFEDDGAESKRSRDDPSLSTAEKKRLREKKRRDEINKGFDQLMSLVLVIDPELRAEADDWAKNSNSTMLGGKEENLLTRGDLMNHTSRLLRKLYAENEEHKRTIATLRGISGQPLGHSRSISMGPIRTVSFEPMRTASIQRHPSGALPGAESLLNHTRVGMMTASSKADNQQQYLSDLLRQKQQENEALFARLAASRFQLDG